MQLGLHRPERRHLHGLHRRKIQNRYRHRPVHRLRGSTVLHYSRCDGCDDVPRVPYQFQFAACQLRPVCVYLQRRLFRSKRRRVHGMRRRNLQGHDW
jgi:hypothetical protein